MLRLSVLFLSLAVSACAMTPPGGPLPRYTIFFTEWSGRIDDPATSTIAAAADAAKKSPLIPVMVVGYADPTGSPAANQAVAALRAQMVTDQLIADGLDKARITTSAHGAVNFVESPQESRRVIIGIGAP